MESSRQNAVISAESPLLKQFPNHSLKPSTEAVKRIRKEFLSIKSADQSGQGQQFPAADMQYPVRPADGSVVLLGASPFKAIFQSSIKGGFRGAWVA